MSGYKRELLKNIADCLGDLQELVEELAEETQDEEEHEIDEEDESDTGEGYAGMKLIPLGCKVPLADLDAGTLFSYKGCIALKSEYTTKEGAVEACIVGSGEFFWGEANTAKEQRELLVQPLKLLV